MKIQLKTSFLSAACLFASYNLFSNPSPPAGAPNYCGYELQRGGQCNPPRGNVKGSWTNIKNTVTIPSSDPACPTGKRIFRVVERLYSNSKYYQNCYYAVRDYSAEFPELYPDGPCGCPDAPPEECCEFTSDIFFPESEASFCEGQDPMLLV